MTVVLFLFSLVVNASPLLDGKDVSTSHPDRTVIADLSRDYLTAFEKKDTQKLKAITSPEFFRTLQTTLNQISESQHFSLDQLRIVETEKALLVQMVLKDAKGNVVFPHGDNWYQIRKVGRRYRIEHFHSDWTP